MYDPYSEEPPEKIMNAFEFGMLKSEALWVNVIASRYRRISHKKFSL